MGGRGSTAFVLWLLVRAGGVAVTVVGVFATRVFLMYRTHYTLIAAGLVASLALAAMSLDGPRTLLRCLRRLAPVGAFALASLIVAAITSARMPAGSFSFFRVSLGPVCWFSSAVLGYLAGRTKTLPLAVAAVTATVSAGAGALSLLAAAGRGGPLAGAYSSWSASLGAWAPGAGEAFRSVGLEVDPNTFGLIGAVALVAALCFAGPARLRALTASASAVVIVLSGSRTSAVAALLALGVVLLVRGPERLGLRRRVWALMPVLAGVVIAALACGGVLAASGRGIPALVRLGDAATAMGTTSGAQPASAVDAATSGRAAIWSTALAAYRRYPLGAFLVPESLVGRSIHNEYLERLLYGGPLLALALIALQLWFAARVRPVAAPALGAAIAVVYAAAAMALGPSVLPPFLGMAFYFVGWGRAQPDPAHAEGRVAVPDELTETSAAAG